jgi:hypothetical protein
MKWGCPHIINLILSEITTGNMFPSIFQTDPFLAGLLSKGKAGYNFALFGCMPFSQVT